MKFDIIKRYKLPNKQFSKLFFFHVPKCGGLSIAHSLGVTIPHLRILGALHDIPNEYNNLNLVKQRIQNANKSYGINLDSYLSSEIFQKTKKLHNKYPFISGHIPFNKYEISQDTFVFSVLRDPVSRSISNYLFFKKRVQENFSLNELYEKKFLLPNMMTSFFSSIEEPDINIAIKNIKQINMIVDINQIKDLLGYIISLFKLPNMVLTSINETKSKYELSDKEMILIMDNNKLDIKLYDLAKKLFFDFENIKKDYDCMDAYSIFTENKLFNNSHSLIFKEKDLEFITKTLSKI